MAGKKLLDMALDAARASHASRHIADPAQRAANLSRFMEGSQTPPVLYHGTHGDISEFKPTPKSHFGFHFGDVEAANSRLEDTAKKAPWPKEDLDRRYAVSQEHFNNL